MDKKKVLFLASWYPSRLNPTLGNFNEKFAEAAALQHHVTALHVAADSSMKHKTEEDYSLINGVHTHIVYFKKKEKENRLDKIFKALAYLKYYVRVFKAYKKSKGRPHIIHLSVLYPVGVIALLVKIIYGIPYVISEHWTGYLPANFVKQNFFVRWLSRRIAANASALMPVSADLKKAMTTLGFAAPYHIVHNVTDTNHFRLPEEKRNPNEKKIILHVSSLKDDHKNITGILNVTALLWQERKDFELHIVGDGNAEPHIKHAANKKLLNTAVHFFDAMTPQQVAQKMQNADLFLLFSNYENLPCVIVEALATGLPVISSTAGGIPEHLSKDKGILVPPKDEEALFNACMQMLDSHNKYDKKKLHEYAKENFSYESVSDRLTKIYSMYGLK